MSRFILAMILACSLVAIGCSPAGQAAPPTRTSTTTRTAGPSTSRPTVAPPVTRTLDLASYRSRPCDLLKPEQRGLFDGPGSSDGNLVVNCGWSNRRTENELRVHLAINADYFNEFLQETRLNYLIFEQRTVGGQPAVVYSGSQDPRYCDVLVGTGPRDSIVVHQNSGVVDEDSCVRAMEWAERIVHNLGG